MTTMAEPKLTLYYAPGSSSMAPHIALHEVGAEFEAKPLSFASKQTRTPEFLAINPLGQVPTLVIDGRALTEVGGILFYLACRFPGAGLLPHGDVEAQAHVVSWISYLASTVHPARRRGADAAREVWLGAERKLGTRIWAVTDRYSIADIFLFRLFWRYSNAEQPARDEMPNLCSHQDRVIARPAVQRTLEIEAAIGYELPGFRPPVT
jgi:glutathione S-transferase